MKTVYIDGSPKPVKSNSGYLLELVKARLPKEEVFAEFRICRLKGGDRCLRHGPNAHSTRHRLARLVLAQKNISQNSIE